MADESDKNLYDIVSYLFKNRNIIGVCDIISLSEGYAYFMFITFESVYSYMEKNEYTVKEKHLLIAVLITAHNNRYSDELDLILNKNLEKYNICYVILHEELTKFKKK
jgi:hypothetical protein